MKKISKKIMHYWFVFASVLSFLAGWALLAHSPKPVQPVSTDTANFAPLQSASPIQIFGDDGRRSRSSGSGLSPFVPNSQPSTGLPLMRTGGS
jgi:hypothetical protein